MALALAACGGGSSTSNSGNTGTAGEKESPGSHAAARKVAAAVQNNIRLTLLTDAKLSCPSQALPGKGHSLECQLRSSQANGTLKLTQEDPQGKCFLYTGRAGPYSWSPANHNVICVH
jgi:hypothetical protein